MRRFCHPFERQAPSLGLCGGFHNEIHSLVLISCIVVKGNFYLNGTYLVKQLANNSLILVVTMDFPYMISILSIFCFNGVILKNALYYNCMAEM